MPAPSVRSISSVSGETSSTFLVATPTGTQQGDILLVFQATSLGGGTAPATPSGFTALTSVTFNSGGNTLQCFWLLVGASVPANWTFNNAGGGGLGTSTVWMYSISGAAAAGPDHFASSTGTSASPTAPSLTTTVANSLLCCAFEVTVSDTITPPGDLTDQGTIQVPGVSVDTAYRVQVSAGATGNEVASSGSDTWCGMQVSVPPTSSGTPGPLLRPLIVSNRLHPALLE